LLVSETLPVTSPPLLGSKIALNEVVAPGLRVTGNCSPPMLKPDPVTLALLIVTLAVPVLVRFTA
jgi:hypothetical protein